MKARIRERRQITLPREVCESLGVDVGDALEMELGEGVLILRPAPRSALDALSELRKAISAAGVAEDELLEEGRRVRTEVFRERYPELARKYGV